MKNTTRGFELIGSTCADNNVKFVKIEEELVRLDTLRQTCRLWGKVALPEFERQGQEGCTFHKEDDAGYCFSFNCPLAFEAELSDMKRLDKSLYREYRKEPDMVSGSGCVVQYQEVA